MSRNGEKVLGTVETGTRGGRGALGGVLQNKTEDIEQVSWVGVKLQFLCSVKLS